MKKYIIFLFIPFLLGAAPSRQATYTTNTVISSVDVTANEDAMFNYMQAGVDTYAPLSISNAAVSATANIQSDKLNLTSIAQAVGITAGGSLDNNGTTTLDGTVTMTNDVTIGAGAGDSVIINANDGITYTPAATWTFTAAQTVSGTWADLGTITTLAVNAGTLTGLTDLSANYLSLPEGVAPTTAASEGALYTKDTSGQPELFYREESDGDEVQMTNSGAVNASLRLISTTTVSGATNTGNIAIVPSKQYLVTFDIENTAASDSDISLRFNSSATATGYQWAGEGKQMNTSVTIVTDGDESDSEILLAGTNGFVDGINATNGWIRGQMFIDTNKRTTIVSAMVNGAFTCFDDGASPIFAVFGGLNVEDLVIADFEFVFSQTTDATIKVYEFE